MTLLNDSTALLLQRRFKTVNVIKPMATFCEPDLIILTSYPANSLTVQLQLAGVDQQTCSSQPSSLSSKPDYFKTSKSKAISLLIKDQLTSRTESRKDGENEGRRRGKQDGCFKGTQEGSRRGRQQCQVSQSFFYSSLFLSLHNLEKLNRGGQ